MGVTCCFTLVSLYVPSGQRLRTFPSGLCTLCGYLIGFIFPLGIIRVEAFYCSIPTHGVRELPFFDKVFVPWPSSFTVLCEVTRAGLYIKLTFNVNHAVTMTMLSGLTDS